MPTSLSEPLIRLNLRLKVLERAFLRHRQTPVYLRTIDRFAVQEGLVSNLWQSWNRFCRDVTVGSALGSNTASGVAVTSNFHQNTDAEIAFAAKKLSQNQAIGNMRAISGDHLEPTWGDFSKLSLIISGLGPTNAQTLLTGFGSLNSISDLQLCRNASAHISSERIADVRNAKVRYQSTKFYHPSDMLFWIEPYTNDYLWKYWADEILAAGALAIS